MREIGRSALPPWVKIIAGALSALAGTPTYAAACMPPQPVGSVSVTGGNSCQLVATQDSIDAVFIYADAGGQSTLSLPGYGNIFTNFVNTSGDSVQGLPTYNGQTLSFTLTGITVPNVFVAGVAASNGKYHAAYRDFAHFADLNIPDIGPGNRAYDYIATHGGESAWTFVAWEDYLNGDYDYNDLVFAFRGVAATVPESPVWLMLALGLATFGFIRTYQRRSEKTHWSFSALGQ